MNEPRRTGGKPATINDIARLAEVSKKTVSRVINNSPFVKEETRKRVEAIIAEVAEGRGEIIDHERQVGGYPAAGAPTRKIFNPDDWDLRFMTPVRDDVLDRPAQRRGT